MYICVYIYICIYVDLPKVPSSMDVGPPRLGSFTFCASFMADLEKRLRKGAPNSFRV